MSPRCYKPGDRILVTGGYDMEPAWLAGGTGYPGVITVLADKSACVKLDAELVVSAAAGKPWQDFGQGSARALRDATVARGNWLVLSLAYVGAKWTDPVQRLHVGLCELEPNLSTIPKGGGAGYWVESHTTCRLLEQAP
jgi:hypothetical protein